MNISLSFDHPRLRLGAERLRAALEAVGLSAEIRIMDAIPAAGDVFIAVRGRSAAVASMEEKDLLLPSSFPKEYSGGEKRNMTKQTESRDFTH